MMTRARAAFSFAGVVALTSLGGLASVGGQEGQQGQAGPPRPAAADLVFEREVFQYPSFERRNPFRELVGEGSGPRFESMRLRGIIFVSTDPSQSMILMAAGSAEQPQSRHMRVGEQWGNVRILEIRRNEIVVAVEEFGMTEQRIMQLPTPGQGGS